MNSDPEIQEGDEIIVSYRGKAHMDADGCLLCVQYHGASPVYVSRREGRTIVKAQEGQSPQSDADLFVRIGALVIGPFSSDQDKHLIPVGLVRVQPDGTVQP